jgi:hypothetical protein
MCGRLGLDSSDARMHLRASRRSFLALGLALSLAACGGGGGGAATPPPPPPPPPPEPLEVGDTAPNFALEDVNPGSPSFGQLLGPSVRPGFVTVWYFVQASSAHGQQQFGLLEQAMLEIRTNDPAFRGEVLGVNAIGEEASNGAMVTGRVMPWLQDVADEDVWDLWVMTAHDLVVLDPFGRVHALDDLTLKNLATPATYDAFKQTVLAAALAPPP